jgi:hypothetical protein
MQVGNPLPGRGAPHSAGNLIINPVLDRHWSAHTQRSTLLQLTRAFQNPSFPRSLRNSLSMLLTSWTPGITVLCIDTITPPLSSPKPLVPLVRFFVWRLFSSPANLGLPKPWHFCDGGLRPLLDNPRSPIIHSDTPRTTKWRCGQIGVCTFPLMLHACNYIGSHYPLQRATNTVDLSISLFMPLSGMNGMA